MSSRPSASVATIGFPIARASNAVSGVPSQSDGNTLRSNADSVRATSRRKPAKTNRSPRPSARRLRLQIAQQRTFADHEKARRRPLGDDPRRGVDQVRVALRLVEPRDRADRQLAGSDAELRGGPRQSPPRSARG